MKRIIIVPLLIAIIGCNREADFKISIANRDKYKNAAIVDGRVVATLDSKATTEVTITAELDAASPTSSSSKRWARVTFNAQRIDTVAGLSRGKELTLWSDRVNYVEINSYDFYP